MNRHYPAVAARARNRCEYCHAPGAIFNLSLEVEHVIPISKGGEDSLDNLALACRSCNLHKTSFITGKDPQSDRSLPLFHPRRQNWNRHFKFDTYTGQIRGQTRIGRATILRLQVNNPLQVAARQQWMFLDLFP